LILIGNLQKSGTTRVNLSDWFDASRLQSSVATYVNYVTEKDERVGNYQRIMVYQTFIDHFVDDKKGLIIYIKTNKKKSPVKDLLFKIFDEDGKKKEIIKPIMRKRGGGGGGGGGGKKKSASKKTTKSSVSI
jgi:hypothetical protein